MSSDSLKLVKNHLEASMGDLGVRIYHRSISKLNISANPSRKDLEALMAYIEMMVVKLYGNDKSKAIIDDLRKELADFDKFFDKFFGSKIKDTMDHFFEMKGVPGEPEIEQISKYLISNGYEQNEKNLTKMLKQYSKEKIIWAFKWSIINNNIKSFLDSNPAYTQIDVEFFINQMKQNKFDVDDTDIKDKIEKERLFRKFNYMERRESEDEKISRQCTALFNSNNKMNYEYIFLDKELVQLTMDFVSATVDQIRKERQ
jgi:hypothetical protein